MPRQTGYESIVTEHPVEMCGPPLRYSVGSAIVMCLVRLGVREAMLQCAPGTSAEGGRAACGEGGEMRRGVRRVWVGVLRGAGRVWGEGGAWGSAAAVVPLGGPSPALIEPLMNEICAWAQGHVNHPWASTDGLAVDLEQMWRIMPGAVKLSMHQPRVIEKKPISGDLSLFGTGAESTMRDFEAWKAVDTCAERFTLGEDQMLNAGGHQFEWCWSKTWTGMLAALRSEWPGILYVEIFVQERTHFHGERTKQESVLVRGRLPPLHLARRCGRAACSACWGTLLGLPWVQGRRILNVVLNGVQDEASFTKSPRKRKRLRSDLQVAVLAEEGETLARWLEQYERTHAELMHVIERYNRIALCGGRWEIGRRRATGAHQDWVTATTLVTKINGGRDTVQMDEMKSRGDGGTEARLGHQCWVGQRAKRYWKTDRRILRGYTGGRISMNIGPQYSPAQAKMTVGDAMLPELQEWLDFYYEVPLWPSSVTFSLKCGFDLTAFSEKILCRYFKLIGAWLDPVLCKYCARCHIEKFDPQVLGGRAIWDSFEAVHVNTLLLDKMLDPLLRLRDHLVPPMPNQLGVLVFGDFKSVIHWPCMDTTHYTSAFYESAPQGAPANVRQYLPSPPIPQSAPTTSAHSGASCSHSMDTACVGELERRLTEEFGTTGGVIVHPRNLLALAVARKTHKNRVVGVVVGVHDAGNLRLVQPKVVGGLSASDWIEDLSAGDDQQT
ncbi:hypothetical protein DFH07DRAFT_782547 [Mycena maculata]|uniref:Uncharacterized protein n=1 Tax=Mycena maculata TaxID=230809 RepID=A0AAD7MPK9_9AGAR|nr:hypothetical protein DFH07DRAFT_782596 [Mycena maculata]KAJ7727117.1 hypothetical protein DFH07DRAFT_782547 [Mycena maculata]